MHSALLVPEIVDLILTFLYIEELPQVSQTCRAFYDITEAQRLRRQPHLRDLIKFLPEGLVCEGKLKYLRQYSGDVAQEALFPLNVSSVLPSRHQIKSQPGEVGFTPHSPPEPAIPNVNIMNAWNGGFEDNLFNVPTVQFQFVAVFLHQPIQEDLQYFLQKTTRCSKLSYSYHDYKAFLVMHALERLFPGIVFFPHLREIVIIPSLRAVQHAPPRSLGLYTPFSLMRRVHSVTIFDNEIGAQRRYADQVFRSLHHLPTESLGSLRAVTYTESTKLYGIKRIAQSELFEPLPDELPPLKVDRFLRQSGPALSSLKMTYIPLTSTWKALAHFTSLEELEFGQFEVGPRFDTEGSSRPSDVPDDVVLPLLRKFTCRRLAISAMLPNIFRSVRFPCLTDIILEAPHEETNAQFIRDSLELIGKHVPTLRHLHVDVTSPDIVAEEPLGALLSIVAIEQLMMNANELEYLYVACSPHTTIGRIDDVTVLMMAFTWPRMKHLYLDPLHSPLSMVTLEGLIPLARSLRDLNTLDIGLHAYGEATDIAHIKDADLTGLKDHPSSSLTRLDVGTPWTRDAASCAEFLRAIFPSLKYLRGPDVGHDHTNLPANTERVHAWDEVSRLIREGVAIGAGEGTISKHSVAALGDWEDEDDDDAGYYYDSSADQEGSVELSE